MEDYIYNQEVKYLHTENKNNKYDWKKSKEKNKRKEKYSWIDKWLRVIDWFSLFKAFQKKCTFRNTKSCLAYIRNQQIHKKKKQS